MNHRKDGIAIYIYIHLFGCLENPLFYLKKCLIKYILIKMRTIASFELHGIG